MNFFLYSLFSMRKFAKKFLLTMFQQLELGQMNNMRRKKFISCWDQALGAIGWISEAPGGSGLRNLEPWIPCRGMKKRFSAKVLRGSQVKWTIILLNSRHIYRIKNHFNIGNERKTTELVTIEMLKMDRHETCHIYDVYNTMKLNRIFYSSRRWFCRSAHSIQY